MDVTTLLNEKIAKFEDLKKQLMDIAEKIGVLQEEGRALHMAAMEVRGAIESLAQVKAEQDKALAASKTAQLILPEGTKPVMAEPAAPAVSSETSAPITLEVR